MVPIIALPKGVGDPDGLADVDHMDVATGAGSALRLMLKGPGHGGLVKGR
jgi:hypothetical protein